MGIEVQNLAELSNAQVEDAFTLATSLVQEKYPNIDTKRGVISELVLGLDAILSAAQQENAQRVIDSQSLLKVEEDPTRADADVVDQIASNYNVIRREATYATGEVTIVISQQLTMSITAGSVFTYGEKEFTADATYTARTTAGAVIGENDRLLTQIGDSLWAFTINVIGAEPGSAYLLHRDNELAPELEPTGFVRAYATSDFVGGLDAETTDSVLARMDDGMSTKAYSNRTMIKNAIRAADTTAFPQALEEPGFANILEMSIVGFGDEEMLRDQHWLWPMSGGGRSDIYVRSQQQPVLLKVTKTATLVSTTPSGGVWQAALGRADAPGCYEVRNIRLEGAEADGTNYAVQTLTRQMDLTGDVYVPDIESVLEATFSRYQTLVIQFLDTDTDTTGLTVGASTAEYDITVAVMPLIEEVQTFIGHRNVQNPVGDHLVKAPIPCFVSVSVTLERSDATQTVSTAAIESALAQYTNTTGFPGKLYAADLSAALASVLPTSVSVSNILMNGRVLLPDDTETFLSDNNVIEIPTDYANFTSSRTSIFILDPDDVAVTINDISVPGA